MKKIKLSTMGWVICSLAAIFYCYEYLLRITPSVMVSELMTAFQINATELGMLSAFFYFTYTPMQIIVGPLSDIYGPRRILILAILTCTLGSYIFSVSDTLLTAAIGRALIGFGSSFAFVCILKLADSWLPQKFFALFVGLTTALGMIGAIFQITTFSVIINNIGWKNAINLGTITGLMLIPLIWLIIRDHPSNHPKKTQPNYSKILLGLLTIIKNPQMWINGIIACILYLSLSLFAELWGIPFLSQVYQLSKSEATSTCSMIYLGWLIGGPLVGYLSDVTCSRKMPIVVGYLLATLTISIVVYLPTINILLLNWLLFFFGLFASAQVICFAISSENNPKYLIATASSFTNFLTMISGFIAQPMVGKILDLLWSGDTINGLRYYSKSNYQIAFFILPLSFIVGFILTFFLRETGDKKKSEQQFPH